MNYRQIEVLRKIYDSLLAQERLFYPNYPKSQLLLELELIIKESEIRLDYSKR